MQPRTDAVFESGGSGADKWSLSRERKGKGRGHSGWLSFPDFFECIATCEERA